MKHVSMTHAIRIQRTLLIPALVVSIFVMTVMTTMTGCAGKKRPGADPRLKRGSPEYYLNEGLQYLNSGNLQMAEKSLRAALKKNPDMVGAINGMGIIYLNKRDFDNAAMSFRQVIKANPKNLDAYNYLGIIFSETGQYDLAKESFLTAANDGTYHTPENAFANLARLELTQKKIDSALRYALKGLAANKNFAPVHNILGVVYEEKKDYDKALYHLEKALSLLTQNQNDVTFMLNVARVYGKKGDKRRALDLLERALGKTRAPSLKAQIRKMMEDLEKPAAGGRLKKLR